MAGQLGLPRWASDGPEMLFPTKLRVKISSRLSYPVGAELISSELADVPQAQSLEVRFHGKYERMETRGQPYSIFTVSYAGTQSYQPGWSIEVRPVPRALKHAVKETLTSEFFPRIRKWLEDRADLNSRHGDGYFWRKSDKSREREGSALAVKESCLLTKLRRSWYASFEDHTSARDRDAVADQAWR